MRLLEAILKANLAAPAGAEAIAIPAAELPEGLPLAVLSCIDARLNHLLPARLGIPEEQLVWLRNAGNIVTGPLSSTTRSLALACALKGAREIAVVGHTDCRVCQATMLKLTEAFRALGVERHQLPENLVEYFGLFASERQNVMRAAEILRSSPLIGGGVPVHGLLLEVATGRLEGVVNGYESQGRPATALAAALHRVGSLAQEALAGLPELKPGNLDLPQLNLGALDLPKIQVGETKLPDLKVAGIQLPEIKVGGVTLDPNKWIAQVQTPEHPVRESAVEARRGPAPPEATFDKARRYKVIGVDQKIYGPISGLKVLDWVSEGRIGWDTPSQAEGSNEWRPLGSWAESSRTRHGVRPPRLPGQ